MDDKQMIAEIEKVVDGVLVDLRKSLVDMVELFIIKRESHLFDDDEETEPHEGLRVVKPYSDD